MELNLELYKKVYLIRMAEEKIRELYNADKMKTPMHMSMGEEAIAVGVCHALKPTDQIFGTYRSHAVYIAKTGETDNFFAEMYGKGSSLQQGKAGSMHLCAPDSEFLGTSAIVGSGIPISVGAAFANKRKGNGKVVAVFFGDGAIEEGAFWESLNVASLMKLPVLFVCEDNHLAVHTHKSTRQGYNSITDIVSKFNCNVLSSETTDVELVYELSCNALQLIEREEKPCFLYLKYYRYLEHVGINEDFDCGYRSRDEFLQWHALDPVILQRKKLIEKGCPEEKIQREEMEIDNQINGSIMAAEKAPLADTCTLYEGVYV